MEDVKLKSLKSSVSTCQQLAASYLERETRASSDHVISERLKQIVAKLEQDRFRLYVETADHGDDLLVTSVNSAPKISVTITCPSYLIDVRARYFLIRLTRCQSARHSQRRSAEFDTSAVSAGL